MKIGIISDTHDNIEPTKKAINFLKTKRFKQSFTVAI